MSTRHKSRNPSKAEGHNDSVREFLHYYAKLNSPNYAVMLTGVWGSGKTWFVRDALGEIFEGDEVGYMYVSLYGMTSVSDIESEFFRQLHPILSSPGAKFAGTLLKGVLKGSVSLDLFGKDDRETSVSAGVPSESLFGKASPGKERLLVFDDLERCAIKTADLLGYINQFVEHHGYRVILVCNEEEVKDEDYGRIREKVVGRSFQIEPQLKQALLKFLNEVPDLQTRKIAAENLGALEELYEPASRNLRLLHRAIQEFSRVQARLDSRILKRAELLREFFLVFLSYALAVRSGDLLPAEVGHLGIQSFLSFLPDKEDKHAKRYRQLRVKYPWIDRSGRLLSGELWREVFEKGAVPAAAINEALLQSRYFADDSKPTWLRFWHARELSDEDFRKLTELVLKEWDEHVYVDGGTMLHVFGTLLLFAGEEMHPRGPAQIVDEGKKYVDWLEKNGYLASQDGRARRVDTMSHRELGFNGADCEGFNEVLGYLNARANAVFTAALPQQAAELLGLMEADPPEFHRRLVITNQGGPHADTPLLHHVQPSDFMRIFVGQPDATRCALSQVLMERYQFGNMCEKLLPELDWLEQVVKLLEAEIAQRKGTMTAFTLRRTVLSTLTDALQKLRDAKARIDRLPAAS